MDGGKGQLLAAIGLRRADINQVIVLKP